MNTPLTQKIIDYGRTHSSDVNNGYFNYVSEDESVKIKYEPSRDRTDIISFLYTPLSKEEFGVAFMANGNQINYAVMGLGDVYDSETQVLSGTAMNWQNCGTLCFLIKSYFLSKLEDSK